MSLGLSGAAFVGVSDGAAVAVALGVGVAAAAAAVAAAVGVAAAVDVSVGVGAEIADRDLLLHAQAGGHCAGL